MPANCLVRQRRYRSAAHPGILSGRRWSYQLRLFDRTEKKARARLVLREWFVIAGAHKVYVASSGLVKMEKSRKVVQYFRVSTTVQERSGLGLAAQELTVKNYLNTGNFEVVGSFTEVETGKGSNALDRRPQLREALALCKRHKATLVIAKLDRLARNVHFISGLLETGIDFVAADMPNANKTMLQLFSVMSEWERDAIALRTRQALAAAKSRGVQLGRMGAANLKRKNDEKKQAADEFAVTLARIVNGFRAQGMSQRAMVTELNTLNIPAAKGGQWQLTQFRRVLKRIDAQASASSDTAAFAA